MIKLLPLLVFLSSTAFTKDFPIIELRLKDHKFSKEVIEVKAGERFIIHVFNDDTTGDEFESKSMIVEKFIGGKKNLKIILGPLKPGEYDFFACFNPSTGKGKVIAK